jgi:hypothetical protein
MSHSVESANEFTVKFTENIHNVSPIVVKTEKHREKCFPPRVK